MALGSNKRNIRSEIDKAAGDNNMYIREKINKDESVLNLGMNERQTVIGRENSKEDRYFGGLIGNKEIFVMTMIAVALYLIEGEHAKFVCTSLTSVPPAIFSYKVLMSPKSTKEGYHSILFYWTIYGLLAVIDQFVGSPQGYNLIKGGLLGAVFLHAFRSNPHIIPYSWHLLDQTTAGMLTSILTRYDSQGYAQQTESSGFEPRSPTVTHFSEEDELEYMPMTSSVLEQEPFDVSTAVSFQPSVSMQSTQKVSPEYVYKTSKPEAVPMKDESVDPCSTIRINYRKERNHFETLSAMTYEGAPDIVTVPSDQLVFKPNKREAQIQVTNVSSLHIMYSLKTNADTHLIAAPTTGVLFSGQSIQIRVGVTDAFFESSTDPGKSIDKIAIDYVSIPQNFSSSVSKFSQPFFASHHRRRHPIRVFYQ